MLTVCPWESGRSIVGSIVWLASTIVPGVAGFFELLRVVGLVPSKCTGWGTWPNSVAGRGIGWGAVGEVAAVCWVWGGVGVLSGRGVEGGFGGL